VPTRQSRFGLPLLRRALEPAIVEPKLQELFEPSALRPALRSGRLIAVKTGSRALIEYRLEWPGQGRHLHVVAKHFAHRAQARRVYRAASSLSGVRSRFAFAIPPPFGWLAELGLVVYLPLIGPSLDDAILRRNSVEDIRRAAQGLATLHASQASLDRHFDLRRELLNLEASATLVAVQEPDQADAVLQLADELARAGRAMDLRLDVPIHKDFHYQHVVTGPKLGLLDLDEMRFGDPSFDVAHFCAYLDLLALRSHHGPEAIDPLIRSFVAEYAACTGWTPDEGFTFFAACAYLKIAKQLSTGRGVKPRPTGPERRAQLALVVERGRSLAKALS
jgi:hypothetical protein